MIEAQIVRYVAMARKWWWLIAACTAIAAGLSLFSSANAPRVYVTSVTLMVGESTANPNVRAEDFTVSQRIAAIYAGMVRRQPVLEATISALGLQTSWQELGSRVLVFRTDGTQLLDIRVSDTDPYRAAATADELARQLILQSPTAQNEQQLATQRQFVARQLANLQENIQKSEAELAIRQAELDRETGARGVLSVQDSIGALETKLNTWRATYATLLSSHQVKSPNALTVLETAGVPTVPTSPDVRANVLAATGMGFALALLVVILIEYINGARLHTAEDAERTLNLPVLASITDMGKLEGDEQVGLREPHSLLSDAYHVLRTNLRLAAGDPGKLRILVTSPGRGEGKSVTSAQLAVSFAQIGKRTILVDTDLRHPSVHTLFGVQNQGGLTSLLLGEPIPGLAPDAQGDLSLQQALERRLAALLVPTSVSGLSILPAGPTDAIDPPELLAAPDIEHLMTVLGDLADVVIFDTPPVLPVADTTILAALGPSVVLVTEAGRTSSRDAREARQLLVRTGAPVLGFVLNRTPRSSVRSYYHRPVESRRGRPLLRVLRGS